MKFPLTRMIVGFFSLIILITSILYFFQAEEYSKDEIPVSYTAFPLNESLPDEGYHGVTLQKYSSIFMKYEDYDESIIGKNISESIYLQFYDTKFGFVHKHIKHYYVKENYYRPIETNEQVDEFYLLYGRFTEEYYIRKDNYVFIVDYDGSMEEKLF